MSKIFGPIFTFLLAIPLALVPVVAIVGLPSAEQLANGSFGKTKLGQMITHVMSTPEESDEEATQNELEEAPAWGGASDGQGTPVNPVTANDTAGWGGSPSVPSMTATPSSSPVMNANWQNGGVVNPTAMPAGSWQQYPMPNSQGPQITWQQAVGQLNSMGIRDYHLKPGHRPGEFYFFCFFTPRDRPQVTIRYEAEADDPLKAVENVLQQIQSANYQAQRPAI